MTTSPMPEPVRRGLLNCAIVLVVVAAVGNFGHVYDWANHDGGQGNRMSFVDALLPDVVLVLTVVKLRYSPRSVWAWCGLVLSVGFVAWASIATATASITGRSVAVWPLLVAIIAAGLLEAKPQPVAAEVTGTATGRKRTRRESTTSTQPEADPKPKPAPEPPPVGDTAPLNAALSATSPVHGEADREKRARLGAARGACVTEVYRAIANGHQLDAKAIAHAYGAGTTWAKAVRADAVRPRAVNE